MIVRYTLADGRVIEVAIATDSQPDDESSTPPDPAKDQERATRPLVLHTQVLKRQFKQR